MTNRRLRLDYHRIVFTFKALYAQSKPLSLCRHFQPYTFSEAQHLLFTAPRLSIKSFSSRLASIPSFPRIISLRRLSTYISASTFWIIVTRSPIAYTYRTSSKHLSRASPIDHLHRLIYAVTNAFEPHSLLCTSKQVRLSLVVL